MAKPVVFVIGATGNIGSATVTSLSAKFGDKLEIRAGVRSPEKAEKLKALSNVNVVKAEMGGDGLVDTLKGVDRLYIVTPGTFKRAELTIKTAEAAKAAGVKFTLIVSVLTADLTDTIFGKQLHEVETAIKAMGIRYCFLRLPYFVDNFWGSKDSIQKESSIYGPSDETKEYTPVCVADAGNAAAIILSDFERHVDKTYNLVSHRISQQEIVKTVSAALEREVKYVRIPYENAKKAFLGFGLQEWQVDGVMELFKLMDSGSSVLNVEDLSDYEKITGEKPTSFKDWFAPVAGAFK